jgi:hypothetical protein
VDALWRRFQVSDCYLRLPEVQADVFALLGAIGRRVAPRMAALAEKLLKNGKAPRERDRYLLAAGMLGDLADGKPEKAYHLWETYASRALSSRPPDVLLRLLWAHSVYRSQNQGQAKP